MYVYPHEENIYEPYFKILQAIYGDNNIPDMKEDNILHISNSYIIGHIIPKIKERCPYRFACNRKNPLHKCLMHGNIAGGKRSTGKRSTGKRSTGKRSTGKRSTGKRRTGKRSTGKRTTRANS